MIKTAIVGAAGYSGLELISILSRHPYANIHYITSNSYAGKKIGDIFPNLAHLNLTFSKFSLLELAKCDLVFFATPNLTAMQYVPDLLAKGIKVIDLSADFRIQDIETWQQYYAAKHQCSELISQAAYGLSEFNTTKIKHSNLIANPGCYPTATLLGLWPALNKNLIQPDNIIIDAKSGISGAGRTPSDTNSFANANENFKAYNIFKHRHTPEIIQGLNDMSNKKVEVVFVPHLVPMTRGIHATIYCTLYDTDTDVLSIYTEFYKDKPFIKMLHNNIDAETNMVSHSNDCIISIRQQKNQLIICSVIDNLVKGASGQAVQNMNIMYGFKQETALRHTTT